MRLVTLGLPTPLAFLPLFIRTTPAFSQPVPCSICQDGNGNLGAPDKVVTIPGLPLPYSCRDLENLLPLFIPDETSEQCGLLRSVGTLCGCPKKLDACELCGGGDLNSDNNMTMSNPDNELPFFSENFGGFVPTCEMVGAYLHSFQRDNSLCSVSQSFIASYCGCGAVGSSQNETETIIIDQSEIDHNIEENEEDGVCHMCGRDSDTNSSLFMDRELNITGFPFSTCGQLASAAETLFPDGSEQCSFVQSIGSLCGCPVSSTACHMCIEPEVPIQFPDKPVQFLESIFGFAPSCRVYESFAHSIDSQSQECAIIQASRGFCGCPPLENHCEICPGEVPPSEFDHVEINEKFLKGVGLPATDIPFTCELAIAFQYGVEADSQNCLRFQSQNFRCGCSNGSFHYLDATTDLHKAGLVWVPRITAIISLIAAILVIVDVLMDTKAHKNLYHQLVFLMAISDGISSAAWMFTAAPIPADDLFPIYGAKGNDATCTAQAFFTTLGGTTSIYYNVAIAAYYYFVLVKCWRGTKLDRFRPFLLIIPALIGAGIAFGAIPFYGPVAFACSIEAPPFVESSAPSDFLFFLPAYIAISICTILMGMVYWRVRQQNHAARKWKPSSFRGIVKQLSGGVAPKKKKKVTALERMERQVLWQATLYLLGFYVTWPFAMICFKLGAKDSNANNVINYGTFLTGVTIFQLQGFFNAFTYFRPRLIRRFQKRRREKRETIHLSGSTAEESKFGSFFSFRKKRGDEIKASQEVREQEKSLPVEFDSNDEAVEQGGVDPSAFIATERYSTLPSVAPEAPTTHSGQMERVEEEESKMPEEGQISSGIGNVDNEEPSNPGQLSRDKVVYQTRRASDGLMLSLVAERVPSLRESARDMT